jgi:hypothetical protein
MRKELTVDMSLLMGFFSITNAANQRKNTALMKNLSRDRYPTLQE